MAKARPLDLAPRGRPKLKLAPMQFDPCRWSLRLVPWLVAGLFSASLASAQALPDVGDDALENLPIPVELDPLNGPALAQAVAEGRTGLVEFHDPDNFGAHDFNTVALSPEFGNTVMAIALLHEWKHVKECGVGLSHGGVADSPPQSDPCAACGHVLETAASWTKLTLATCSPPCPWPLDIKACEARDKFRQAAKKQWERCKKSACTSKPTWGALASWSLECYCCTL